MYHNSMFWEDGTKIVSDITGGFICGRVWVDKHVAKYRGNAPNIHTVVNFIMGHDSSEGVFIPPQEVDLLSIEDIKKVRDILNDVISEYDKLQSAGDDES